MMLAALYVIGSIFAQGGPALRPVLAATNRCSAVQVRDGRVVGAGFYRRMVGFAAEAGTRGGLGRRQMLVWRTEDGESPGTLRHALKAAAEAGGGWISFAPALAGKTIRVDKPLRLSSHVTIDGGCSAPRLVGSGRGSLLYLRGVSHVVVARLHMQQTGGGDDGDCVTVSHGADRIWIAQNRIQSCRDGLVDVTRNGGGPMRVTVSGNWFGDHDKAMLVDGGPGSDACSGPPGIRLTLFRNRFERTGQRHPRAAGSVFVHAAQNAMRFRPQARSDGSVGGSYGIFASSGARVLAEDLLFDPQGNKALRLVITEEEASGLSACRAAAIRVERSSGPDPVRSIHPDRVGAVPYALPRPPAPDQLERLLESQTGPAIR
jgi:pectate lyase